ncbi:MAG: DUF4870 domain-containing protein [Akkermansiaceae bacterium]|jgi:hypothetical protein|nr:DUF4870 domain-containing protein [Akkermansiaceae bacterium]
MNPPPPSPDAVSQDDKTFGMLCHLSGLIASSTIGLGFVGPLIVWLIKKDQSPYVDAHGKEALNFYLTLLIAVAVCVPLVLIFVGILLLIIIGIGALVLGVLASVAAYQGRMYHYPICIRFIK